MAKTSDLTTTYVRRLGAQHFAHLRAVADGVPIHESAMRYLGVDHKAATLSAHRQVTAHLRALARRRGDSRWRLIGISITKLVEAAGSARPSIEEWSQERGLEDWGEKELLEMYEEAFPTDRRHIRNNRLRERQRQAILELQAAAAETPLPTDMISGWFDDITSARLLSAGILTLANLRSRIDRGGRWWSTIPSIAKAKAARISSFLEVLIQPDNKPSTGTGLIARQLGLGGPCNPSNFTVKEVKGALPCLYDGTAGSNRAPSTPSGTTASTDQEAIAAWVEARAGSQATAISYLRETERLLIWSISERQKPISSMNIDDCMAYMTFLEHIPDAWVSRRRVAKFEPGWAPFAGQLSHASRKQALTIVSSLFEWLVSSGYLLGNPWRLVNRHTGDDINRNELDTRAFTPEVWSSLLEFVEAQPTTPSSSRVWFLLKFLEATGLRAAEILGATVGDLRRSRGRWVLQVHGKGSKNRVVAVPGQALLALEGYLASRCLGGLDDAPATTPLVANTQHAMQPIKYQALYESTKSWFRRAILSSELSNTEKTDALRGSLHWLRHTCGTRALERGAPLEVVQSQLGHKDPRTTMKYSKPQLERLQDGMDKAFG